MQTHPLCTPDAVQRVWRVNIVFTSVVKVLWTCGLLLGPNSIIFIITVVIMKMGKESYFKNCLKLYFLLSYPKTFGRYSPFSVLRLWDFLEIFTPTISINVTVWTDRKLPSPHLLSFFVKIQKNCYNSIDKNTSTQTSISTYEKSSKMFT